MNLRYRLAMACLPAVLLSAGCGGTLYATMASADGEPVMLLGHDPVAYFTTGKALRGDPKIKVALLHRTSYSANEEHRRMNDWAAIDDRVMGGISRGRLRHDAAGHAVFEGNVSLERNGGFASASLALVQLVDPLLRPLRPRRLRLRQQIEAGLRGGCRCAVARRGSG